MPKPSYRLDSLTYIDIPMRCFSCNKVLADKFYEWLEKEKDIKEPCGKEEKHGPPKTKNALIMEALGLKRQCCRQIVLSYVMYQKGIQEFMPI